MRLPELRFVGVTGDREGYDQDEIDFDMAGLRAWQKRTRGAEVVVICGRAPGVDTQCELSAHRHDLHTAAVQALWATRHRGAGPQRNGVMAAFMPDKVFAYHHDIKNSKGTFDMVGLCLDHGIPVFTRGFTLQQYKQIRKRRSR